MVKFHAIKNFKINNIDSKFNKKSEINDKMNEDILLMSNEFKGMHNLKDAYNFIDSNNNLQELDLNLFKYKDFYIRTGKIFNLSPYVQNLKTINPLKIKCAPLLVETIPLKNEQDIILITKIPNSENSELIKYNKVKKDIPLIAKQDFINDFDKLAKQGIYNPIINESTNNWLVIKNNNQIYIDDWSNLKTFDKENKPNTLKKELKEMCGLIY